MNIGDRIAPNSREHWVLSHLAEWEHDTDAPVTPDELYGYTGMSYPSADYIADALAELARRNLTRRTEHGFVLTSPGSTALKRHDEPDTRPWDQPTVTELDPEAAPAPPDGDDEDGNAFDRVFPDEPWVSTDEPHVFYGSDADRFKGDIGFETARVVRERLPDGYDVVITVGPYRPYAVGYAVDTDRQRVRLDYYSVRPDEATWRDMVVHAVHRTVLSQRKWEAGE